MKTKIFALVMALAGLFVFSSCEKEVSTLYTYDLDVSNLTEDGGFAAVTYDYCTRQLDWGDPETIDNDAVTADKARQQNDDEAVREFREDVAAFNLSGLYSRYMTSGVSSVQGYITYQVIREDDGEVLASERFDITYPVNR